VPRGVVETDALVTGIISATTRLGGIEAVFQGRQNSEP